MRSVLWAMLATVLPTLSATAADFPSRPIRLVVPAQAGGAADFFARIISVPLSQSLGQPVVVDNKAGASGMLAGEFTAKADPDGYTILMAQLTSIAVTPHMVKKPTYDTLTDLKPITLVAAQPCILTVNPSLPATTVKEFIAYAKANPGKLNFSSAGAGSPSHLAGALFNDMAGVQMVHVPYKGSGPATNAVLANEVQLIFGPTVVELPQIKAGKLRGIAMTTLKQSPAAPGIPTISEAGLPGFEVNSWFGLFAPGKTPQPIVDRIQQEVAKALQLPEIQQRLSSEGAEIGGNTSAEFTAFVKSEYDKYGKIVKEMKIGLEE